MAASRAEPGAASAELQGLASLFQGGFPGGEGCGLSQGPEDDGGDHLRRKLPFHGNPPIPSSLDLGAVEELLLHHGKGLLQDQDGVVASDEVLDQVQRQRYGGTDLKQRHVRAPQGLQHVPYHGVAQAAGDDPQTRRTLGGDLEVVLAEGRAELPAELFETPVVSFQGPSHGHGHEDPVSLGHATEFQGAAGDHAVAALDGLAAVVHPSRGTQHGEDPVLFRDLVGIKDHGLGLDGVAGVEAGDLGKKGQGAAVLVRLRGVAPGFVRHHQEHAPIHLVGGDAHEGIHGHIEPHLFHDGAGALAGERGPYGVLQGHLLVGAPLHHGAGPQLLGPVSHGGENFRRRSPWIGRRHLAPGFHQAPGDGFVAQHDIFSAHPVPCFLFGDPSQEGPSVCFPSPEVELFSGRA
ncbi:MAG: hypothetical protein BWY88_00803 [Synergistetes bacterium ADurb.Bin520]|nr:MAG: hypothetical protein BWY88_00803 [Synergistetes bacterium ADurb.Bin520]